MRGGCGWAEEVGEIIVIGFLGPFVGGPALVVLGVEVGAAVEEELDDVGVFGSPGGGPVQGRAAVIISEVDVEADVEQESSDIVEAVGGGPVEGGFTELALGVKVGVMIE